MSLFLKLTPYDPLIARDGRPFGAGQGNRMRSLTWLLPSVVAGSFRSALIKGSNSGLDFSDDIPNRLLQIAVAGVFPIVNGDGTSQLYLPAPGDAVAEPHADTETGHPSINKLHRTVPIVLDSGDGGCDLPAERLRPVGLPLSPDAADFKPARLPAWWPADRYADWLVNNEISIDREFLNHPIQETRDHVRLDPECGAAEEGLLFATTGLSLRYLPRFGRDDGRVDDAGGDAGSLGDRFAPVSLAARIDFPEDESELRPGSDFGLWHPLGGERRMVHWQPDAAEKLWHCPQDVADALTGAKQVRMVLATPAIFAGGWKPGWLDDRLEGSPPASDIRLRLIGVTNGRWQAVSGWSMSEITVGGKPQPRGPKPIRRMAPAGSVYFFDVLDGGSGASLAQRWLQPVSDGAQEQRDGFGLAAWGIWQT